ncbi:hypothetical protein FDG2_2526 [Candidatus Protofrankia californiensis]|uniref:Uncharacterized protein n=1 Tax=Candidatus Protofrankia californiensis TaxID=1839754 RepID=A0A1C3NXS0_9ACTN|nr:hypothetical protein FDG2_2526 [Candidatus Protofrankia californiensis]
MAGWIQTWATHLTRQPDLFVTEKALVFGNLETFDVERGIEDRLWGPAPIQHRNEDTDDTTDNAQVEAALAAMGIETADFFVLDDDGADLEELPTTEGDTAAPKPPRRGLLTATTKKTAGRLMMHAEVLDEPHLEFGGGARHIDPRFGLTAYGPADLNAPRRAHRDPDRPGRPRRPAGWAHGQRRGPR